MTNGQTKKEFVCHRQININEIVMNGMVCENTWLDSFPKSNNSYAHRHSLAA